MSPRMPWRKREPEEGERRVKTDGQFVMCEDCRQTIFRKSLEEALYVCPECDYHFRVGAKRRIEITADPGTFQERYADMGPSDPLSFVGVSSYADKIRENQQRTGLLDAALCGACRVEGRALILVATDSQFMMGSMGSVVGEKVARCAEDAAREGLPLAIISGSGGGARMYEGMVSLMQMWKTSAALGKLHRAGGLFISVLTNPTMAGVMASFASLGDVIYAEPRALIGFTGPRVIKQTIKQDLPPGFQESEFLLEHGQIDAIVHRKDMRKRLSQTIDYLRGGKRGQDRRVQGEEGASGRVPEGPKA